MEPPKIVLFIIIAGIFAIATYYEAQLQPTGLLGLQDTQFKIGVILPITGNFSFYGEKAERGMRMALEGKKNIEIILEDDGGNAQKAVSAATKLITNDKVGALLSFRSNTSAAIAPIAQKNNIVLLYASVIEKPAEENPLVFRNSGSMKSDCNAIAKTLIGKKGAVFGLNMDSTQECIDEFKKQGFNLSLELFEPGTTNFQTSITKLKNNNLDFLLVRGNDESFPLMLRQIKELDFTPVQIICPQVSSAGCNNTLSMKNYNDVLENAWGTDNFLKKTTALEEFNKKYEEKYGEKPVEASYLLYENTKIIILVLEKCNGNTECMRIALNKDTFDGLEGPMQFNDKRTIERPINFVRFDGNIWK